MFQKVYGSPVFIGPNYSALPKYCQVLGLMQVFDEVPDYLLANVKHLKEWTQR